MSIYEEGFTEPLLASPWVPLRASPSPLILKYAQHPFRPGYIVLLTDLTAVYLEVLTAPSVPSRLNEVNRHFKASERSKGKGKAKGKGRAGGVSDEEEDIIQRTEKALRNVKSLWDQEAEDLEVEMKPHDYHDAVLSVQTDKFAWLFYFTEIKGRQPVEILSRQLIGPLAAHLLDKQGEKVNRKASPIDVVQFLLATAGLQGLSKSKSSRKVSAQEDRSPPPAKKWKDQDEDNDTDTEAEEEYQSEDETIPPARAVARSQPGAETSGTRKGQGREGSSDADSEKADENGSAGDRDDDAATEDNDDSKPAQQWARHSPSPAARVKTKKKHIVASDDEDEDIAGAEADQAEGHGGEEAAEPSGPGPRRSKKPISKVSARSRDRSISPPRPTPSQTRKERERAEEHEMHERAEAMKRKMEAGGAGGGNLGRRRLRW